MKSIYKSILIGFFSTILCAILVFIGVEVYKWLSYNPFSIEAEVSAHITAQDTPTQEEEPFIPDYLKSLDVRTIKEKLPQCKEAHKSESHFCIGWNLGDYAISIVARTAFGQTYVVTPNNFYDVNEGFVAVLVGGGDL
jgi:hypothetical protein